MHVVTTGAVSDHSFSSCQGLTRVTTRGRPSEAKSNAPINRRFGEDLPLKDAMADFWPQPLKNRFFLVIGISKSITRPNESLTFTFNGQEP